MSENAAEPRRTQRLAVRIWAGIGALFVVLALAVALCIGALLTAYDALRHISELGTAERHAVAIGVAAREQYIHQSHGALLRDDKHLGHDRHWGAMLAQHVEYLRPLVDAPERARLETIESESNALSKLFVDEIFPAALTGEHGRIRAAHRDADAHMAALIGASDASVAKLSMRTREASAFATSKARRACVVAALATAIAALIAALLARAFAQQVIDPVRSLEGAARRIGRGEFAARIPAMPTWEFEQLRHGLRQMADGLREREIRLLEAERLAAIGRLAAGVAHELNNPLGVMLGYLKRLLGRPADAVVVEELRIVDDEAQQCRRIVEDLVTFAREPKLVRAPVDVAALARDVGARLSASPEAHPLVLEAEASVTIEADATRLAQVMRNLVLNAAAASRGESPVELAVENGEGGGATILVRDRGAGIEPEDLPHVFEPFHSRRPGGTGLGLAVCHGIVRAHGGRISIDSAPGKGTTVRVELPATPTPHAPTTHENEGSMA
ncbi:MAG: HAMP domain-containing histidine kinase [Deltaproteobacteria bacterium]|nr:HAMP domain-containing histidine kinase [Deltaproteobacteria bacterium]